MSQGYRDRWQEGTTIPAEYYVDETHYLADERYLAENLWLYVDHEGRIPQPGDYFVFEYGRSDSVILVRDSAGEVRGFHNVCRHRGSRLCRHDADAVPGDPRLSVKQLGQSDNSPVFRCPYHAWTYDIDGKLTYAYGMQEDFDPANNGLVPCHLRTAEGSIFVNLSQDEPPDFESSIAQLRTMGRYYGHAGLKIVGRERHPIHANWKLVLENFAECYHCGSTHKGLVTTHHYDHELSPEQMAARSSAVSEWLTPAGRVRPDGPERGPRLVGNLNAGFVTGAVDGKSVAPLLPAVEQPTHGTNEARTGHYTGYWQNYDDYVVALRFTPRDVALTDCEAIWLAHPDAVEGRDYDLATLKSFWQIIVQEDIWVIDNNHRGILSGAYRSGPYSTLEGTTANFIKWYMGGAVASGEPTDSE
ncbi:MAG TPA: aromatic ring-hydroxylating dioxygenase subunit alpha [Acidobacteriota bacterium]|nr:aromatic ring-hydroxylating dioxygenase subunit alpha [Acidobacteriota bacterium]